MKFYNVTGRAQYFSSVCHCAAQFMYGLWSKLIFTRNTQTHLRRQDLPKCTAMPTYAKFQTETWPPVFDISCQPLASLLASHIFFYQCVAVVLIQYINCCPTTTEENPHRASAKASEPPGTQRALFICIQVT